ncbi:MAG: TrbC/VirB2 family protein [Bilophila wadsworthia]|uniref:TrbC/VirB2 family protein n=1 Tax=Bilophila wadsworthia TaxID=35833 RepID=UPI002909AFB7|nr:TrbC/VirB2 family protein [Bilophila wadsworthia]MDU4377001.1 TrbC/VirB2 family protein [Bilophila wadsworthia]
MKKGLLLLIVAFVLVSIMAPDALATAGSGGGLPYEPWLETVKDSITGPWAFFISIIGIVAGGSVLMMGGDTNGFFRTIGFIVLVMSFTVGANNIMSGLFGKGALIVAGVL